MSTDYLLDNAAPEAGRRFSGLEACYDEATLGHLRALGLGHGWRVWEIGAGGGSVARRLAAEVGAEGRVLATDINLDWVGDLPANCELRRHDVTAAAIPQAEFDLVHARLVLVHLPQRDTVIAALVDALRPGGWLVLEEFDSIVPAIPDPHTDGERAYRRAQDALFEALRRRGADPSYTRTLPWRLCRAGLVEVGAEGRLVYSHGGSPGAEVQRSNLLQVGDQLVEAGLASRSDLDTSLRALDDPEFICGMPLMVSAWGRRPG